MLRHYAGSSSPQAKEKDLSGKRGGCDEAVEVTAVAFERSSIQFKLRSIGTPFVLNKSKKCKKDIPAPDEYLLTVTDFNLDQTRGQAENAIGYVLQTPEAYLTAYGASLNLPPPTENESPVEYPRAGLTAPKPVLEVTPHYSETDRKADTQGLITVRCIIGTDGLVHSPVIEKGLSEDLNRRALNAMTFFRIEPVREGSRSVAAKISWEFRFRRY